MDDVQPERCPHEHLDEEGYCRRCGADMRSGIDLGHSTVVPAQEPRPQLRFSDKDMHTLNRLADVREGDPQGEKVMPLILICANCGLPINVKFATVTDQHPASEKVDCHRCHTIFQVTVNLLHEGDPYDWNPNTGILSRGEASNSVDAQRCPHGHGTIRTCPICKEHFLKGQQNVIQE